MWFPGKNALAQRREEKRNARRERWAQRRRTAKRGVIVVAALAVVTGVVAISKPDAPELDPAAATATLSADLDHVQVAPRDPDAERQWDALGPKARETYFGRPWIDTDHNGCATDDDTKRRDLTGWTAAGKCNITGGTLPEPYDVNMGPVPNAPGKLQLDHVVAVHLAYDSGMRTRDQSERVALANDPDNLIYTDTHANESKGDDSISEYTPPNQRIVCRYVISYVTVVARYHLTMTPAEHDAATAWLARCPTVTTVPGAAS